MYVGNASRMGLSQRERDRGIQPGAMDAQPWKTAECPGDAGDMAVSDLWRCEVADVSVRPERQDEAAPIERGPGFWSAADWIPCADGKWRPVEPGTFPLAHGLPARVGRLRGYGNAIVPQVAAEFIGAYMDICDARMNQELPR
jgi:DNA (cytosine-5)-methyltransferase 1